MKCSAQKYCNFGVMPLWLIFLSGAYILCYQSYWLETSQVDKSSGDGNQCTRTITVHLMILELFPSFQFSYLMSVWTIYYQSNWAYMYFAPPCGALVLLCNLYSFTPFKGAKVIIEWRQHFSTRQLLIHFGKGL